MINNIVQNKSTRLFIILGGIFIVNAFIAEIIGVKIFSLEQSIGIQSFKISIFGNTFSFNLTTGVLLWPIVFILTDIINEYYGTKGVKFLSNLTIGLLIYSFIMLYIAIHLVPADWWITSKVTEGIPNLQVAYAQLFGQGVAIIIGSLTAFLIGQIIDVTVFHKIKSYTGEQYIWLRATGSTLISQFIDSFVVLVMAFYIIPKLLHQQHWNFSLVLTVCFGNYIYKFLVAIGLTPVLYGVHYIIDAYFGEPLATQLKKEAQQS